MTDNDRSVSFGRYLLKFVPSGSVWRGASYRGDERVGAILSEATKDEVVAALKRQIDEIDREFAEARARDGFPCAAEVHLALTRIPISKGQDAMLHAHLRAPDMILTATQLAKAAGSDHYEAANSQYGKLGKKRADQLDWSPPHVNGGAIWTFALATGANDSDRSIDTVEPDSDHWKWRLRPQIAEALTMLKS